MCSVKQRKAKVSVGPTSTKHGRSIFSSTLHLAVVGSHKARQWWCMQVQLRFPVLCLVLPPQKRACTGCFLSCKTGGYSNFPLDLEELIPAHRTQFGRTFLHFFIPASFPLKFLCTERSLNLSTAFLRLLPGGPSFLQLMHDS